MQAVANVRYVTFKIKIVLGRIIAGAVRMESANAAMASDFATAAIATIAPA